MTTLGLAVVGLLVGYAATVHADYLIHRHIWHGRWRGVHRGPLRWLLYPHFVHHMRAHHRHADTHRATLDAGDPVPADALAELAARHGDRWTVRYGLRCTEHGITIRGPECVAHYLAVYLVTPQPYVAAAVWLTLGPVAGVAALVMPLCAVCTQVSHRYYHMSAVARGRVAPPWLRWAVRSREFARLADEHHRHHYDPAKADDFYGVLPFGHRLLRPLLGRN